MYERYKSVENKFCTYRITSMKPDRRQIFITGLGVFQLIFGLLFLTLGAWALIATKSSVERTAGAPFWLAGLCFFNAYLAVVTPRHFHKQWVSALIYVSCFVCLTAISTSIWLFFQLLKVPSKSTRMYYVCVTMGLNILLMLDSGVTAAAAWSAKEGRCTTLSRRSRRRQEAELNLDPPPPYFGNRMMFFGGEDFRPPPSEAGAPPPYEP
ncbi:uncharacterized protein LOC130656597 isoform X3 [Hydractinia symbiolongicarpus]|uniref:uncharacterized protein LOC130656597 isoform X3 n=1 Tax=Hydractinia symbiolongicarpus TaxID=13093 RepID=UPI0025510DCB|nr:uncharacterized protein LOC130656597 isoform X3 [Hydractinia symbiolongicarpus]